MARDIVGAIRKVTLDGVTFTCMADTNISEVGSAWENSDVPTSGRTIRKMVKRSEKRENVVLACNGAEREILKELSERTEDYTMSYETAAGDVYRTMGWIDFATRETEENRATITLFPRDKWESFLA
jgi:hypothetical protein